MDLPWVPSISDDKQNHSLRCLQQGSPHHHKWMGPMVGWHNGGVSWKQDANAGNDSSNWGETQH